MSDPLTIVLTGKAADIVRRMSPTDQPSDRDLTARCLILVAAVVSMKLQEAKKVAA